MTIQEAKETVVLAGKRLVESGLIARTWGNVSCRISETHFVITPSGRDYLSLTPEEIVEVAITDCSYSGAIKPSSEKGVHAEVYKLHPDINFVIHTHQECASYVSALCMESIKVSNDFPSLKGEVICAAYGLPGTKKLRKGVAAALAKSQGNAVIMKNHGALCFEKTYEDTFQVAMELEKACGQFILDQQLKFADNSIKDPLQIGCLALSRLTNKPIDTVSKDSHLLCESERKADGFRLQVDNQSYEFTFNHFDHIPANDINFLKEIKLHNEIYQKYQDINNILHSNTIGIMTVSCAGLILRPLLDDFAQIAGTKVKTAEMDAKEVCRKLKGSSVVFLQNNGALCCGGTKGDAHAAGIVTEKNSHALISAALFGNVKYINTIESKLMRFVYLKKYSKQVNKK